MLPDCLLGQGNENLVYILNDVHYYLHDIDWTLSPRSKIYCTGNHYRAIPGKYLLPCGNGEYQITPYDEVTPCECNSSTIPDPRDPHRQVTVPQLGTHTFLKIT